MPNPLNNNTPEPKGAFWFTGGSFGNSSSERYSKVLKPELKKPSDCALISLQHAQANINPSINTVFFMIFLFL